MQRDAFVVAVRTIYAAHKDLPWPSITLTKAGRIIGQLELTHSLYVTEHRTKLSCPVQTSRTVHFSCRLIAVPSLPIRAIP